MWWPGIDKELEFAVRTCDKELEFAVRTCDKELEFAVRTCDECQGHHKSPAKAPMHPWEWPQ